MPRYEVHTTFYQAGIYTITARSKKDAEERFDEGEWDSYQDDDSGMIDAEEEIKEITKI